MKAVVLASILVLSSFSSAFAGVVFYSSNNSVEMNSPIPRNDLSVILERADKTGPNIWCDKVLFGTNLSVKMSTRDDNGESHETVEDLYFWDADQCAETKAVLEACAATKDVSCALIAGGFFTGPRIVLASKVEGTSFKTLKYNLSEMTQEQRLAFAGGSTNHTGDSPGTETARATKKEIQGTAVEPAKGDAEDNSNSMIDLGESVIENVKTRAGKLPGTR